MAVDDVCEDRERDVEVDGQRHLGAEGVEVKRADLLGELRFTPGHIEVALRRRTNTPALLDAGYQDREIQVPWWDGRTLSYSFPAR